MTNPKPIPEVIAEAIRQEIGDTIVTGERMASVCKRASQMSIQALQAAGYAIVPVQSVAKQLISAAFLQCQPDRGDVFSWIDDNGDELAAAMLSAWENEQEKRKDI